MSVEAKTEPRPAAASRPPAPEADSARHPPREPVPENPAAAAIRAIPPLIGELKSYASVYVSAKLDGMKVSARNAAIYAGLGVLGLIVAAGVIVTAVALLLVGLAHGLGALLGGHIWLGDIIVGVLILGIVALGIYLPLSKIFKASRTKTEQKYEGKRIQQRVEHGRDVSERAAAAEANGAHEGNGHKPRELSEAEFLAKQATDAKAAMAAVWSDLTHSLKNAGDLTLWTKRYPWISTGVAAVAGFAASYAFVPVTKEEAKEKWQSIKSAVTGVKSSDFNAVEVDGDQIEIEPPPKPQTEPPAKGVLAMVVAEVFKTLRPALISLLGSAVGGKIAQKPEHEQPQPPGDGESSPQAGSDF